MTYKKNMSVIEKVIKVLFNKWILDHAIRKERFSDSEILLSFVTKVFSERDSDSCIFRVWYGKLADEID